MSADSVCVAHLPVVVDDAGEGQLSVREGGKLCTEIPQPRIIAPVLAHQPVAVEQAQILLADLQDQGDFNILFLVIEVSILYLIIAQGGPYGIEDPGLASVVLAHQDQGILNVRDLQALDGFEILDVQVGYAHGRLLSGVTKGEDRCRNSPGGGLNCCNGRCFVWQINRITIASIKVIIYMTELLLFYDLFIDFQQHFIDAHQVQTVFDSVENDRVTGRAGIEDCGTGTFQKSADLLHGKTCGNAQS